MLTRNPSPRQLRVLVVDDDPDNANSTAILLNLFGHRVYVAFNGTNALHLAKTVRPDVVLLDIRMPGLSGCHVAQLIREEFVSSDEKPLLVAITGCNLRGPLLETVLEEFDLHYAKPVDPSVLIELLEGVREEICGALFETELGALREKTLAIYNANY